MVRVGDISARDGGENGGRWAARPGGSRAMPGPGLLLRELTVGHRPGAAERYLSPKGKTPAPGKTPGLSPTMRGS